MVINEILDGDILKDCSDLRVVPMVCRGFRRDDLDAICPGAFGWWQERCELGEAKPGRIFLYTMWVKDVRKDLVLFPIKGYAAEPATYSSISHGLLSLTAMVVACIKARDITSIAIPALGCDEGELDYLAVREMVLMAMAGLPIEVNQYAPAARGVAVTGPGMMEAMKNRPRAVRRGMVDINLEQERVNGWIDMANPQRG